MPPQTAPVQMINRFLPGIFNSGPQASSMFPAVAHPGGFSTLIPSVQKMINVAQTVTPMVRQYYPLVKQLPALWSMLSSTNQTSEDSNSTSTINESMDDSNYSEKPVFKETAEDASYFSEAPPPKLYI
ncbi:VrrA/YqfQ family protein [Alteribacillus sp. YIM 98480]|uniref:VrrA/YqfQ family protein n=1 Tax=Alteribacillus sp. YIM 98480 TaxID=2606599 RepID=UPI00131C5BD3|nr:VrrA/YqfQ family protein [Alteribacillus sp. YIM 98480]